MQQHFEAKPQLVFLGLKGFNNSSGQECYSGQQDQNSKQTPHLVCGQASFHARRVKNTRGRYVFANIPPEMASFRNPALIWTKLDIFDLCNQNDLLNSKESAAEKEQFELIGDQCSCGPSFKSRVLPIQNAQNVRAQKAVFRCHSGPKGTTLGTWQKSPVRLALSPVHEIVRSLSLRYLTQMEWTDLTTPR